jgi:hypothetical protein
VGPVFVHAQTSAENADAHAIKAEVLRRLGLSLISVQSIVRPIITEGPMRYIVIVIVKGRNPRRN